jgi:hypothetical protein
VSNHPSCGKTEHPVLRGIVPSVQGTGTAAKRTFKKRVSLKLSAESLNTFLGPNEKNLTWMQGASMVVETACGRAHGFLTPLNGSVVFFLPVGSIEISFSFSLT